MKKWFCFSWKLLKPDICLGCVDWCCSFKCQFQHCCNWWAYYRFKNVYILHIVFWIIITTRKKPIVHTEFQIAYLNISSPEQLNQVNACLIRSCCTRQWSWSMSNHRTRIVLWEATNLISSWLNFQNKTKGTNSVKKPEMFLDQTFIVTFFTFK